MASCRQTVIPSASRSLTKPISARSSAGVIRRRSKTQADAKDSFKRSRTWKCDDAVLPHEQAQHDEIYEWFREHLRRPRSFARSSKPHAKNVALSWFKDTAVEHIDKMHALVQILHAHGVIVDTLRTERAGYVVDEDEFQVVGEPFGDAVT